MPTISSYPSIDIPNVDIWEFLFLRKDREYPDDKTLYTTSDDIRRSYTFRDVRDLSIMFGAGLRAKHQWRKGDVVGLFSPNDIDYPVVIWGTHWAGGTASLINPSYTASELEFQMVDAGVKILVTHEMLLPTVVKVAKKIGFPESKILLLGDQRTIHSLKFKHFRSVVSTVPLRKPAVDPKNDLAFLIYSSGTTGKPKGVMLTHINIISNILMLTLCHNGNLSWKGGPNGKGDSVIGFLPFFHSYGLTAVVHVSLYIGVEVFVMHKFDLEKFCNITECHRVTYGAVVPPVVLQLGKSPIVDKYNLSSLRIISSGAAPLTKELMDLVKKRLNVSIVQGYGLSETSPVTHQQQWEDHGNAIGSIGRLLANQTSKFVSVEGEEVPDGQTGELWIKGPNIFKGYLNNIEGTRHALTDDDYFKTGDVGYQDKDGNVFITDRIKELIKYKGFQVAPAELEGILMSHPKVTDVAVVGVNDEQLATEVPRAYIVTAPGVERNDATSDEITTWLKDKVASHKWLRGGIRYIDAVPKTASGKIVRSVLKSKAKQEGIRPSQAKL